MYILGNLLFNINKLTNPFRTVPLFGYFWCLDSWINDLLLYFVVLCNFNDYIYLKELSTPLSEVYCNSVKFCWSICSMQYALLCQFEPRCLDKKSCEKFWNQNLVSPTISISSLRTEVSVKVVFHIWSGKLIHFEYKDGMNASHNHTVHSALVFIVKWKRKFACILCIKFLEWKIMEI